jgi:hypothetical protein
MLGLTFLYRQLKQERTGQTSRCILSKPKNRNILQGAQCINLPIDFEERFTVDGTQEQQNLGSTNISNDNDVQFIAVFEQFRASL